MTNNKLVGKDLINIGIYTALYAILTTAVAMFGYIPILMVLLPLIAPIIAGIPFMLFVTKVKKPGMVTIMGLLLGIYMLITGMGFYAIATGIVAGIITEIILRCGNYESKNCSIMANGTFSMWIIGNFIPIYLNRDEYFSKLNASGNYAAGYGETLSSLMPNWSMPILLLLCIIGGILGGVIGMKILKKHFEKAGMA